MRRSCHRPGVRAPGGAGALAELHLGYEGVEPYPLEGLDVTGPGGEADYGSSPALEADGWQVTREVESVGVVATKDGTTGRGGGVARIHGRLSGGARRRVTARHTVQQAYAFCMLDVMAQGDTTVRVSRETRDEVRRLAAERGVSADQVLAEALRLTRWEALRRQAEREIAEAAADPADRAELAAAVRELTGAEE